MSSAVPSKPTTRSARTPGEAVRAWMSLRDLERAIEARPTVADYAHLATSPALQRGGGSPAAELEAPTITVVLPLLNSEQFLEEALQSIFDQGIAAEVIAVDGGSTDGTLAILERWAPRLRCWLSEPDRGMYDAINKGIALASGDIVKILNGDDLLAPRALEVAREHFRARGLDGCLRGHLAWVNRAGEHLEVLTTERRPRFAPPSFPILHPSWFVPRAIYERVGLYLPYFRIAGDQEYFLHLERCGVEFDDTDQVLALFREGGMSAGAVGTHEALETNSIYMGRARAAALYSEILVKKGRLALVTRALGEQRAEALWYQLKAARDRLRR